MQKKFSIFQHSLIAIDIGGTLAKLCFTEKTNLKQQQIPHIQSLISISYHDSTVPLKNNRSLYFYHFRSFQIETCIDYIHKYLPNHESISLTGGGSYKYRKEFSELGKSIIEVGQFESLLLGIESLRGLRIEKEFITVKQHVIIQHKVDYESLFPFLMVNVGSGVSILKVELTENGQVETQRVGGTCLGGGFFLGLSEIMCQTNDFNKLLESAESGDNAAIDAVPGDYFELEKHMPQMSTAPVLVSLGKHTGCEFKPKQEDMAKSMFFMVAINLAQLALMHAKLLSIERIVFTGFFCRNNRYMIQCFNMAFAFFVSEENEVKKNAFGLRHDGYLGCMGALYKNVPDRPDLPQKQAQDE